MAEDLFKSLILTGKPSPQMGKIPLRELVLANRVFFGVTKPWYHTYIVSCFMSWSVIRSKMSREQPTQTVHFFILKHPSELTRIIIKGKHMRERERRKKKKKA